MSDEQDPRRGLPSASKLALVVDCPGQDNLFRQLLKQHGSEALQAQDEYTEFGNAVHLARQTGNTDNLSEDQLEAYNAGLAFERELIAQWCRDNNISSYEEGPREERLFLYDPGLNLIASAQLDTQHRSLVPAGHHLIIDWKALYAYRTPRAVRNWQGRTQVCCLWQDCDDVYKVRFALNRCQEKIGARDYVDYVEFDIQNAMQSLQFHLWLARQPDAPRRAGDHCYYCPCAKWCPEAMTMAMLPSISSNRDLAGKDPEDIVKALTPDDWARIHQAAPLITKILSSVRDALKGLPKDELHRLGYELPEKGKPRLKLKDTRGVFEYLRDKVGIPEERIWQAMSIGKGDVAELIMTFERIAKKYAEERAGEVLKPFSETTNDAPSLKQIKGI